jgi:hypothetical protein
MDGLPPIKCPKYPAHGVVRRRWLPPEEREHIKASRDDVFEIACPHCGIYELVFDPLLWEVIRVE